MKIFFFRVYNNYKGWLRGEKKVMSKNVEFYT